MINWTSLQLKTSLCERQCEENEKASHRLEENTCKRPMIKNVSQNTQRTLKTHKRKQVVGLKKWAKDFNNSSKKKYGWQIVK